MSKLLVDEISDADNTGPVTVTDGLNVSSGNVGVGISAPVKQIHVESATGGTIRLSSSDTSVDGGLLGEIDWYSNDSSTGGTGQKAYIKAIDNSSYGTGYALAFGTGIVSGGANVISERVRIDYDGIKFNGDTAADNALDDYETGTGDSSITGTGGGTLTTANDKTYRYTKIGNLVHFQVEFTITGTAGVSGAIQVALPFASVDYVAGSIRAYDATYSGNSLFAESAPSSSQVIVKSQQSGGVTLNVLSTGYYFITIQYMTS